MYRVLLLQSFSRLPTSCGLLFLSTFSCNAPQTFLLYLSDVFSNLLPDASPYSNTYTLPLTVSFPFPLIFVHGFPLFPISFHFIRFRLLLLGCVRSITWGQRSIRSPELCPALPCHAMPCHALPCPAMLCPAVGSGNIS